jgi:hypothetical protein
MHMAGKAKKLVHHTDDRENCRDIPSRLGVDGSTLQPVFPFRGFRGCNFTSRKRKKAKAELTKTGLPYKS